MLAFKQAITHVVKETTHVVTETANVKSRSWTRIDSVLQLVMINEIGLVAHWMLMKLPNSARKSSSAIRTGEVVQLPPLDALCVIFMFACRPGFDRKRLGRIHAREADCTFFQLWSSAFQSCHSNASSPVQRCDSSLRLTRWFFALGLIKTGLSFLRRAVNPNARQLQASRTTLLGSPAEKLVREECRCMGCPLATHLIMVGRFKTRLSN